MDFKMELVLFFCFPELDKKVQHLSCFDVFEIYVISAFLFLKFYGGKNS